MSEKDSHSGKSVDEPLSQGLKHLALKHILMIDDAIDSVGEYGEVHLKVEKGRIRFVVTQTSRDALNYEPGGLSPKE